ncbi:uncharacterized protein LOC108680796 [Hyalella azteca]|uniref:Uncharacterized protein LOC108680796 n=1 Tax=Hyalella azteca TaxID=294128 RepID=A0A8B7PGB3_HYAAZ|nr:uncharacterized protein LOC108680796 [Hyalella azteca]
MNNFQAESHDSTLEFMNMRTSKGRTALMLATELGYLGICKKLAGTDVNMRCSDGKTALHYAASTGMEQVISYLVEELVADCSITDNQGFLPLHSSAAHDPEGFAYMLKKTPEYLLNEKVITELTDQAAKKKLKNLGIMAKKAEFHKHLEAYRDKFKNSLLHITISNRSFSSAKALIENTKVSRTETNIDGNTPLHLLAKKSASKTEPQEEERRIVRNELLRSAKEIVNLPNNKGETPLFLASMCGVRDILCSILENKPDVLKCTKQNPSSAVHIAAQNGHEECLRLLLRNLEPNGFSELRKMERHPLHLSARNGHLECSKLLLTNWTKNENCLKNLRCKVKDAIGHYPVDEAFHGRHGELFKFLLSQMEIDKKDGLCVRLHKYFKQCLNDTDITGEKQTAKDTAKKKKPAKESALKVQTVKESPKEKQPANDSAKKDQPAKDSALTKPAAKDFALKKQAAKISASERQVAKNSSFKKAVLGAVIESPWCPVAFDGQFCNNTHQLVSSSSQEDVPKALKPCDSFALLITKHPDLACQAMDKHISPRDGNRELHNYTPFECFYYRIEGNRVLSPFSEIAPDVANFDKPVPEAVQGDNYRDGVEMESVSSTQKISRMDAANGFNHLEPGAEEFSNMRWSKDHPLLKAVKGRKNEERLREDFGRVLCHRLTISWLLNKFRYAQWILYGYLALDVVTAIIATCLLFFTWESQRLQRTFSGATRLQVTHAYDDTRSPYGDALAAARAVMLIADNDTNCSSWGIGGWDSAGEMEVSSAAWNRSVCAVHHLQQHAPLIITFEALTLALLIFHALLEYYYLGRTTNAPVDVHQISRYLRIVALGLLLLALNACDFVLGCRQVLVWQLEVLAVLLVWVHVVATLNKIPRFSGFFSINTRLLFHFTWALLPLSLFLLAFALSFHFLLMDNTSFSYMPYSLVKTITLMLGDFSYDDTFVNDNYSVSYPFLSNILLVVFIVCIMGLVLKSVFGGFTAKIDELRKEDQVNQAVSLLHIHLLIDECVPRLRKQHACSLYVNKNRKKTWRSFFRDVSSVMLQEQHSKTSTAGLLQTKLEKDEEEISLRQTKLEKNVEGMRLQQTKLEKNVEEIKKNIELLLTQVATKYLVPDDLP